MSLLPPSAGPNTQHGTPPGQLIPPGSQYGQAPSMGQTVGMPVQHQGFDIWGPLQRRKYLIVLFCLIGAGLGYLYYSKTPSTYSSNVSVMITTQAPTSIVEGNFKLDKVALSKHSTLIASEMVLTKAVETEGFDKLSSFDETAFPVAMMQNMIDVISETDETLTIICSGPNPQDLPTILDGVVAAYKEVIAKDSQLIGKQTVEMIDQLATKLSVDKDAAEKERLELRQQLGIKSIDENGNIVNPYNKRMFFLQDQQADSSRKLADLKERARLLVGSLQTDSETGKINPINVKVAAIEAQDYFNLDRANYKWKTANDFSVEHRQHANLTQRSYALDGKLLELSLERGKMSDVFGPGHKSIIAIEKQIETYSAQKRDLDQQIAAVERSTGASGGNDEDGDDPANQIDLESFRAQEDLEWITMYELALKLEQERLVSRLTGVNEELKEVTQNADVIAAGILRLNYLQRKIEEKDEAVNAILDRLNEMDILASNYTRTTVRKLNEPKNGKKVAPSLMKSIALGVMLAFMLGLGLAVLVDQSELSFRNPQEIFDRLNVPVVGRIPRINIREIEAKKGHASLVAAHKPSATASESFRDIRTALFFQSTADDIKTILFTSPSPGDGKSTTISNMAISIAQAGKRVILVDADFRRPRVHQYFDEEMNPGLLDVLSGETELKEAIQKTDLQENLYLMTSGGRPANPGELVTSEAFRDLIEALRGKFDYVLVDSPPVLPVSDPASIASVVDGVYLVTRIRKGVKLTSQKAKETLDRVGAKWMGVIINGLDENPHYSEYGYQYGSYSYYGGVYGRYYDGRNQVYRDKISKSK